MGAIVLGVWAFKLLLDVSDPTSPARWFLYRTRDLILAFLGAIGLVVLYLGHVKAQRGGAWRISPIAASFAAALLTPTLVCVAGWLLTGDWPLDVLTAVFLGAGWLYAGGQALYDLFRKEKAPEPAKPLPRWAAWIVGALEAFSWLVYQVFRNFAPRDAEGRRVGKKISLTLIVLVMAMLAASLQGNKDAATTLAGCVAYDGIRFANPPEAIEQNRTYWLVLHQGDLYYIREPPGTSGGNYVIPGSQDLGISRTRENSTRAC